MSSYPINISGKSTTIYKPTICPHCHHGSDFNYVSQGQTFFDGSIHLYVVWLCPIDSCKRLNCAYYSSSPSYLDFQYLRTLDGTIKEYNVPERVKNLSEKFEITYNQSAIAEHNNLTEIAGMGYRKAIEYLIKDYLISIKPDEEENIKKLLLMKCITQLLPAEGMHITMKETLERCIWLGNDHSHYVAYHTDFSIVDMKALISLVLIQINAILEYQFYIENIQPKK